MKHIAFPHPFGTPQGAPGRLASRDLRSKWAAAATAASAAVARHFPSAPSRGARPQPVSAPARPLAVDRKQAVGSTGPAKTTISRWERQRTRASSWVEGTVLVLLIAFFGGGLVAILGGF